MFYKFKLFLNLVLAHLYQVCSDHGMAYALQQAVCEVLQVCLNNDLKTVQEKRTSTPRVCSPSCCKSLSRKILLTTKNGCRRSYGRPHHVTLFFCFCQNIVSLFCIPTKMCNDAAVLRRDRVHTRSWSVISNNCCQASSSILSSGHYSL